MKQVITVFLLSIISFVSFLSLIKLENRVTKLEKSYRFEIISFKHDSIIVYRNDTIIGKCPASKLDSLILKDNE